jgi:pimeloyl-ACP methyl ester carboxylesterase
MLLRLFAGLTLGVVTIVALGGAASALSGRPHGPGQLYDIGGRKLRLVCAGPADAAGPTVWLESGAYGVAEDLSVVQARLAARGYRACAWDRAGMGLSDPGPLPRDGASVMRDRDALLQAAGIKGPFVYVGHSMAGLAGRLWAASRPDEVIGLVLLDAAGPEAAQVPGARVWIQRFRTAARLGVIAANLGVMKAASFFVPDRIGLEPEAARLKRWTIGSVTHQRAAAAEIDAAFATGEQALAAGDISVETPVAVITAGGDGRSGWQEMQAAPARRSLKGSVLNLPDATHTSMLGGANADRVVEATLRVIADARAGQR